MTPDPTAWLLGPLGGPLLVLARVLGLAWTAPAWGVAGLGWRVRVGLAVGLTAVVYPVVGPSLAVPDGAATLGRFLAGEALVGAALGLAAGLVVAAARQAGEIVGTQAGLSPAAILDPDAGDGLTPLGHLYGLVATAVFLALDGPIGLVRVLAESYDAWPAGGPPLSAAAVAQAFGQIGLALDLALRAAAPVALALMLAGAAVGLLGRAAPTLQALSLALPLRAMIGLSLVLLGLTTLIATFAGAWDALPDRLAALGHDIHLR